MADAICVALLRGVNVGGAGQLPMAGLRALLEALGCTEVATYIQSGNAVFRSARRDGLGAGIADAVAAGFGFRPEVMLLSRAEIEAALAADPFPVPAGQEKTVHYFFFAESPGAFDLAPVAALARRGERVAAAGRVVYLHAPEGIGRSELAAKMGRHLPAPVTARNLRTVRRLAEMARAL